MFTRRERVAAGGLASYGVSLDEPFRLASACVVRIIKARSRSTFRSALFARRRTSASTAAIGGKPAVLDQPAALLAPLLAD
jgi:hypothetical protein